MASEEKKKQHFQVGLTNFSKTSLAKQKPLVSGGQHWHGDIHKIMHFTRTL